MKNSRLNESRAEAPRGEWGYRLVVAHRAHAGVFQQQTNWFTALLEPGRRDAWLLAQGALQRTRMQASERAVSWRGSQPDRHRRHTQLLAGLDGQVRGLGQDRQRLIENARDLVGRAGIEPATKGL